MSAGHCSRKNMRQKNQLSWTVTFVPHIAEPRMMDANQIVARHDRHTAEWHVAPPHFDADPLDLEGAVEQQHFANFQLWHEEDKARVPGASDTEIAGVKRAIDKLNQRRNDLMELCDLLALSELAKRDLPKGDAPLHSESIGLILDRLSILALKIFHTREEIERSGAPATHAERNRSRLEILNEQRSDLAAALDVLWADVLAGRRRFKIYRQLKMYNEPALNPSIYGAAKRN